MQQRPRSEDDVDVLTQLRQLVQPATPTLVVAGSQALRRVATWGGGGALAVGLLLAAVLIGPPSSAPTSAPADVVDTGFMPLVSSSEWQRTLAEQRQAPVFLIPATLPRERLALMGLPFDAARADQPVQAELMLHPSGQLLAVRFVQ
jgi:hypothetical protein